MAPKRKAEELIDLEKFQELTIEEQQEVAQDLLVRARDRKYAKLEGEHKKLRKDYAFAEQQALDLDKKLEQTIKEQDGKLALQAAEIRNEGEEMVAKVSSSHQETVASFKTALAAKDDTIEDKDNTIAKLNQKVKELQEKGPTDTSARGASLAAQDKIIAELRERLQKSQDVQESIRKQDKTLAEQERSIALLSQKLQEFENTDIGELKQELGNQETRIAKHEQTIKARDEEIKLLKEEGHEDTVKALKSQNEALEGVRDDLSKKLAEAREMLAKAPPGSGAKLKQEVAALQKSLKEVKGKYDRDQETIQKLQQQVKDLKEELQKVSAANPGANSSQEVEDLKKEVQELKENLVNLHKEYKELEEGSDVEAYNKLIDQMNEESAKFTKVLKNAILLVDKCGQGPQRARKLMACYIRNILSGTRDPNYPIPERLEILFEDCFAYKAPQCTWDTCMNHQPTENYVTTGLVEDSRYHKSQHLENLLRERGFHLLSNVRFPTELQKFVNREKGKSLPVDCSLGDAADACSGVLNLAAAKKQDSRHAKKVFNP